MSQPESNSILAAFFAREQKLDIEMLQQAELQGNLRPLTPGAVTDDMRQRMLARATEFLSLVRYVQRPQPRADLAILGRSRQMLAGGL